MEQLTVLLQRRFLVILACLSLVLGDCMEDLLECTKPMPDIDVILLGVEKMTKEDLTQHCTTYDDVEACVQKRLYNCKNEEWDSVGKLRATFSYICYEDFDAYLEHSACLSHVPGEDVCRDKYKTEIIKHAKTSKKSGWVEIFTLNSTNGICNATKDYLDCIEAAANATCGQAAAVFQYDLLRRGLVYEVEDIDCDLGYDPLENGDERRVLVKPGLSLAAVAAIGLAIALGIAALAVGSRYLCLKYGGELSSDEDELLADDTRSEISTDSGKATPSRASTSRAGTSASAVV